jgi:hypothetical protein
MLTELQCKEIALQITCMAELEKISAHCMLNLTKEFAKLILSNEEEDYETRAKYGKALVSVDSLVEQTEDGIYNGTCEHFFDDVSKNMVRYASQYVIK